MNNEDIKDENACLKQANEQLKKRVEYLELVMKASASIAGKYWFECKMALCAAIDNREDCYLQWMMDEYNKFIESEIKQ